jgi:hypothetical protein
MALNHGASSNSYLRVPGSLYEGRESSSALQTPTVSEVPSRSYPPTVAPDDGNVDVPLTAVDRVRRYVLLSRGLSGAGLLLIVLFSISLGIEPIVVREFISDYMKLQNPSSPLYKAWLDPNNVGIPTYRRYYFYNVTNPYNITKGEAPILVETGPYVYKEVSQKYDVRWYLNGSVGYRYKRLMFFDASQSVDELTGRQLAESDNFTTLNPALKGILYRVGLLPPDGPLQFAACAILAALVNQTVVGPKGYFTVRPVGQLLWGYNDTLWTEVHPLIKFLQYEASTVFQSEWNGSAVVPSPYTYRSGQKCPLWTRIEDCNSSSVGMTMEVSGKTDNVVIPATQQNVPRPGTWLPWPAGEPWPSADQAPFPEPQGPIDTHSSDYGRITQWAGQQSEWYWGPMIHGLTGGVGADPLLLESEQNMDAAPPGMDPADCRVVSGSDGTRFAPGLAAGGTIDLFVDMIGRAFRFRDRGATHYEGIEVHKYNFEESTLADSDANRYCYSMRFAGLFNLSRPAFAPGLGTRAFFQQSCFWDDGASVPGDPNKARRCTDRKWMNPNWQVDDVNDGFTGPTLTLNLTFLVPPVAAGASGVAELTRQRPSPTQALPLDDYLALRTDDPNTFYASFLEIHQETGITLSGKADAMVSLVSGPFFVDGCGHNHTFVLKDLIPLSLQILLELTGHGWIVNKNFTSEFFANGWNTTETVLPFLRMTRVAKAQGYWLDKLRTDLRLLTALTVVLWVGLGIGIVCVIAAIVIRCVVVPRIAAGDPAVYEDEDYVAGLTRGKPLLQDG